MPQPRQRNRSKSSSAHATPVFSPLQCTEPVLNTEHRRRIDRRPGEDILIVLAALLHAEDLRHRPPDHSFQGRATASGEHHHAVPPRRRGNSARKSEHVNLRPRNLHRKQGARCVESVRTFCCPESSRGRHLHTAGRTVPGKDTSFSKFTISKESGSWPYGASWTVAFCFSAW